MRKTVLYLIGGICIGFFIGKSSADAKSRLELQGAKDDAKKAYKKNETAYEIYRLTSDAKLKAAETRVRDKEKEIELLKRNLVEKKEQALTLDSELAAVATKARTTNMENYKYNDLYRYFEKLKGAKVRLTFEEIASISGVDLPPSAYRYIQYWHPSKTHTITRAWIENGWKMTVVTLGEYVDFEKVDDAK